MDLIECRMCYKPISPNAESCPNCGEPNNRVIVKASNPTFDREKVTKTLDGVKEKYHTETLLCTKCNYKGVMIYDKKIVSPFIRFSIVILAYLLFKVLDIMFIFSNLSELVIVGFLYYYYTVYFGKRYVKCPSCNGLFKGTKKRYFK
ncbi:MAG: hypothetical protein JEZ08_23460 [Clostridiales bacterium]|nr:hypothetical protein [Clostridiales bacterium]